MCIDQTQTQTKENIYFYGRIFIYLMIYFIGYPSLFLIVVGARLNDYVYHNVENHLDILIIVFSVMVQILHIVFNYILLNVNIFNRNKSFQYISCIEKGVSLWKYTIIHTILSQIIGSIVIVIMEHLRGIFNIRDIFGPITFLIGVGIIGIWLLIYIITE